MRKKSCFWVGAGIVLTIVCVFAALFAKSMDRGARAISIIGGADGPTSIFLAGKIGSESENLAEFIDSADLRYLKIGDGLTLDFASDKTVIYHEKTALAVNLKVGNEWGPLNALDLAVLGDDAGTVSVYASETGAVIVRTAGGDENTAGKNTIDGTDEPSSAVYVYDIDADGGTLYQVDMNDVADVIETAAETTREADDATLLTAGNEMRIVSNYYPLEDGRKGFLAAPKNSDVVGDLWYGIRNNGDDTVTWSKLF